jgi:general bacterial porin, GBP family
MQNKKVLVLAISAALASSSVLAQKRGGGGDKDADPDSVVVLYGKLYPEVIRQYGSDATPAGTPVATFAAAPTGTNAIITRNEMESSNSRFGVRGHEKLGGGLRAVFQLETQFLLDSNTTQFAARDSWVGLKHDNWGLVKLGRFDTPFKEYGDDISFLGVSSGNFTSTSAIFRRFGFGTSSTARFHERRQNAVQYESPEMGGIEFKAMYSTDEADTAARKPQVYSFGGAWEVGAFKIMAAYEQHKDLLGLSRNVPTAMSNTADAGTRSKDEATALAVQWRLGRHTFEIDANWKKWVETPSIMTTGKALSYKNRGYIFGWDWRVNDQWRVAAHYVKSTDGECSRVNAVCVTDGLDGSQVSVGLAYHFSRKTYLFFMAQSLKNGKSAIFASGTQTPNDGEDVRQYAVGIHTAF